MSTRLKSYFLALIFFIVRPKSYKVKEALQNNKKEMVPGKFFLPVN